MLNKKTAHLRVAFWFLNCQHISDVSSFYIILTKKGSPFKSCLLVLHKLNVLFKLHCNYAQK